MARVAYAARAMLKLRILVIGYGRNSARNYEGMFRAVV